MSSEFVFLSQVSHAIDLKAEQMTSRTQILTAEEIRKEFAESSS